MKKQGFTLIETVIIVGIVSTLMMVITSVLLNSVRLKSKTSLAEKVSQNGNWAPQEMRRNLLNATGMDMVCPDGVGSYELIFMGRDNRRRTLSCGGGRITLKREDEAESVSLTQAEVNVFGCDNFATCIRNGGNGTRMVNTVDFNFNISVGVTTETAVSGYAENNFQMKVTMRN